ncbi:MAG TPA: hypothetical protein VF139_14820 [Candidatus Polarisedimenticolaceae bacterium]
MLTPLICSIVLAAGGAAIPAGENATVRILVEPTPVAAGTEAKVTAQLVPNAGIKINKYPKIKLAVAEQAGLVAPAEGTVGAASPPPPEDLESNYFKTIDPVALSLKLDAKAAKGKHEIPARLTYFYCVAASGYCAPARVNVKIPVEIR